MIAVIAKITLNPGTEDQFLQGVAHIVPGVAKDEPGNKMYELFKGDEADVYYFIELYEDEAAIEAHRVAPHFIEGSKMMKGCVAGMELTRLAHVPFG